MADWAASRARRRASKRVSAGRLDSPTARWMAARNVSSSTPSTMAFGSAA
jgi:hypothetical protein